MEQHLALMHVAALGADGEDAERRAAEHAQRRHPLDECDVVFDPHLGALSFFMIWFET